MALLKRPRLTEPVIQAALDFDKRGNRVEGPLMNVDPRYLDGLLWKALESEDPYAILAEPLLDDVTWEGMPNNPINFDIIPELTELPILRAVAKQARTHLISSHLPLKYAVDLGSGPGSFVEILTNGDNEPPIVETVIAVDKSAPLLGVHKERYGNKSLPIVGDVTNLDFIQPGSIDLAVSGGLTYSLGRDGQEPFFRAVSKILSDEGVYLDGNYAPADQQRPVRPRDPDSSHPKRGLTWLIKMVTAPEGGGYPLHGVDETQFFKDLGLRSLLALQTDENGNSFYIRTVSKLSS